MKSVEKHYLLPFCIVTLLFLLWGIAANMTDTLLSAFKRIMSMTDTQTSFIQLAFYGSYFCFALPAALYIRKYSFKSGIVLGLCLYSAGALLFYPASKVASYLLYLIAIYVMAGGCSILETTANPYILSMGAAQTATRRLNIAQAFNPLGAITGILLSQYYILSELSSASATERATMSSAELEMLQAHELGAVTGVYMALGFVLIVIMLIMAFVKMPGGRDITASDSDNNLKSILARLFKNKKYVFGVIAQFFYMGAQTGVWSFTIRLAMKELSVLESDAATVYLIAVICFSLARFVFTWLMKWFQPERLLAFAAAVAAILCALIVVFSGSGWLCVSFLVLVSFFMSLMFPTIYGSALDKVDDESAGGHPGDSKIGASGLIMAILGGALITPVQGMVSDHTSANFAFVVPLICFIVVLSYGIYSSRKPCNQM